MSPRTMRVWNTCLVAGFLMGGGVASADPFTGAVIADLEASGFQVNEGYPKVYGLEECIDQTYPRWGTPTSAPRR